MIHTRRAGHHVTGAFFVCKEDKPLPLIDPKAATTRLTIWGEGSY
jgi:hypothetical protein